MRGPFKSLISPGDVNVKVGHRETIKGLVVISAQLHDLTKEVNKLNKLLEEIKRKK